MRTVLLITILSTFFWSCTKSDDLYLVGGDIDEATPISINIDGNELTRGSAVVTKAEMGNFGVYCAYTAQEDWTTSTQFEKMNNALFIYNDLTSKWDFTQQASEEQPQWGHTSMSDKYTFYGYSPHSTKGDGITPEIVNGALQIDYEVPASYELQRDLLVAIPLKNIHPQVNGVVNLSFVHALSKVSFSVKGNPAYKVTSITLKDFKNKGTLTFDEDENFSWSNNATIDSFTLSASGGLKDNIIPNSVTTQNITSNNGYLFMLPQNVGGKSVEVTVTNTNNSNNIVTSLTMPNEQVWLAGKSYDYVLNLNEDRESSFHEIYPNVANCYIISPTTSCEITIPINEYISYFWQNYGRSESEKAYSNVIASELVAEPLWYDSTDDPINSISVANISPGATTKYNVTATTTDFATNTSNMAMKININQNIEGNVVIGVRKRCDKKYLWSWHLWITKYNPYVVDDNDENGRTHTVNNAIWMDRNVGARNTIFEQYNDGRLYYQWGRKDPLRPTDDKSNVAEVDITRTITDVVQEPTKFYCGSYSTHFDWCGGSIPWDQDRSHHWRDVKLPTINKKDEKYNENKIYGNTKSIFDPSPIGFMVPCSSSPIIYISAYNFLKDGDVTYDRLGCKYKADESNYIYLLLLGYLKDGKQYAPHRDTGGYWSASAASEQNGRSAGVYTNTVSYGRYSYRMYAFSVRSIKEL